MNNSLLGDGFGSAPSGHGSTDYNPNYEFASQREEYDDDELTEEERIAAREAIRNERQQSDPYARQGQQLGMRGLQSPQLQQRDPMASLLGIIKLAQQEGPNDYQSRTGLGQNMFGLLGG